jgi:hypothetical protein
MSSGQWGQVYTLDIIWGKESTKCENQIARAAEHPRTRSSTKTGDEKPETYMGIEPSPHRKALYLSNV